MSLRAHLAAGLLGLLLAGCAVATPTPDSGVEGRVWVGPMCPVVQEGVDCPDSPLQAELEVLDAANRVVARTRSEVDGRYQIALSPGAYTLHPLSPSEAGLPFAADLPFEVPADVWVELDVYYDSGIR
jgi:hypothetical protein